MIELYMYISILAFVAIIIFVAWLGEKRVKDREGGCNPQVKHKSKRSILPNLALSKLKSKNPKFEKPNLEKRVEKLEQVIRDELKIII